MITQEMLKGVEGLTPEQVSAIVTLSANDEQAVISAKYKEMHDNIDMKIKDVTGIEKNGDKTTDYLARALKESMKYADTAKELQEKVKGMEEQIKVGSADKERIGALEKSNADLIAKFNAKQQELNAKVKEFEAQRSDMQITADIASAMSGIKLNSTLPQQTIDMLKEATLKKIKGMSPEYIDNGAGGKTLSFRDESGVTMRNPDNQLNPYTAKELLAKEFKALGIMEEDSQHGGAGGQQQTGSKSKLTGVSTKAEALNLFAKTALDKGMVNGSVEYQNEIARLWAEHSAELNALQ